MDNLRSHVKTVHQGKAGIKILEPEEGDEVNIVTVASDDMVTLATEALAATAVTQLTGELGGVPELSQNGGFIHGVRFGGPRAIPKGRIYSWGVVWGSWSPPEREGLSTGGGLGVPEPSQSSSELYPWGLATACSWEPSQPGWSPLLNTVMGKIQRIPGSPPAGISLTITSSSSCSGPRSSCGDGG